MCKNSLCKYHWYVLAAHHVLTDQQNYATICSRTTFKCFKSWVSKYFSMQEEKYAKQAGAELCQAHDKLGLAKSALPS